MGTNYYIKENFCKSCGRFESIHLGKSSAGWRFCFNLNGKKYYKNVKEMKVWLKGKTIENEYNEEISQKDFWDMVNIKQKISTKDEIHTFNISSYRFLDCEFS